MKKINILPYEVWYISPLSEERRIAAFHFKEDAEALVASKRNDRDYYVKKAK